VFFLYFMNERVNFILTSQIHIATEKYIIIYNILDCVHVWKNYSYINQEVRLSYLQSL
jgi:hypothetical protein